MKKTIFLKSLVISMVTIGTLNAANLARELETANTSAEKVGTVNPHDIAIFNRVIAAQAETAEDIKAQIVAAEAAYCYYQYYGDVKNAERYAEIIVIKYNDLYKYAMKHKNEALITQTRAIIRTLLKTQVANYSSVNGQFRNFIISMNFKKAHDFDEEEGVVKISATVPSTRPAMPPMPTLTSGPLAPPAPPIPTTGSTIGRSVRLSVAPPSGSQIITQQPVDTSTIYTLNDGDSRNSFQNDTIYTLHDGASSSSEPRSGSVRYSVAPSSYAAQEPRLSSRADYVLDAEEPAKKEGRFSTLFKRKSKAPAA